MAEEPAYTLLGRASFLRGDDVTQGEGATMPALAVLPDRTYFMAQFMETWDGSVQLGTVRMFRLATDLTVLGYTDVPHPALPVGHPLNPYGTPLGRSPVTYAVAGSGMNVVLFTELLTRSGANETFVSIVDCAGDAPVSGAEVLIPVHPGLHFWANDPIVIRDPGTNRIIIATQTALITYATGGSYGQQDVSYIYETGVGWAYGQVAWRPTLLVFNLTTGAYLSSARVEIVSGDMFSAGQYALGVAMDPTDHASFTVTTNYPKRFDFTVSMDGQTTTYDGPGDVIATPAPDHLWVGGQWNYPQVIGTPFLPYAGGIGTEDWLQPDEEVAALNWIEEGIVMTSAIQGAPGAPEYTNVPGAVESLQSGRYALTIQEVGYDVGPHLFECRLYSWDQAAVPRHFEILKLPYFDLPDDVDWATVSWLTSGGSMAVSQTSGLIIVAASVVSKDPSGYIYLTLVWIIQGPSNLPNLAGDLYDDRVRFTP